jgi:Tfp pilus assembly PilM family ATPase
MWDWIRSRPQRCLKFGTDSVGWAERERSWCGRPRQTCVMSFLPAGVVKPSPMSDNVSQSSTLVPQICALTRSEGTHRIKGGAFLSELPRRIGVLLPDTAARTAVMHLDQVPTRRKERDALIRWRLGQEQLFPLNNAKVVSQVFGHHGEGSERAYTVLAVAIQESVLRQYESLCESVGLIPSEVGITSLRLVDLWKRTPLGAGWLGHDVFWITLSDRSLTIMVFQQGQIVFYRCKLLGVDASEALATDDFLNRVLDECRASLEICQQQHPTIDIRDAVICGDGETASLQAGIQKHLQLAVQQFGWNSVETLGWGANGRQQGMASLAAIAGVS